MGSFKDKVEDLHEGLKERLKSPFILTFVTVWIVRHWELVYLIFNFGADYTAIQKMKMVIVALKGEDYWELFWVPLFISFGSFAGYLIVSLLYELIHSLYSKWGRTAIYFISDRNKLVKREDYDILQKEFDDLDALYDSLEEDYENLKEDNLDKFNKINSKDELIKTHESTNNIITTQNTTLKNEIIKLKKIEEQYKKLLETEKDFLTSRARYAIYNLFKYLFVEQVYSTSYVPVTDLFFGSWAKKILKRDDLSTLISSSIIKFEGKNAVNEEHEYNFEILELINLMNGNVYLINTTNGKNDLKSELIFKLSPELYFGLIGVFKDFDKNGAHLISDIKNKFEVHFIVQYDKIKNS